MLIGVSPISVTKSIVARPVSEIRNFPHEKRAFPKVFFNVLTNRDVAELLATEAEKFKPPISRAFQRASRAAILWPEEVSSLLRSGRTLTELPTVGPFLEKTIKGWFDSPSKIEMRPPIRRDFIFRTEAKKILAANSSWPAPLHGDLQMHTEWSDGSSSIGAMAEEAVRRKAMRLNKSIRK